MTAPASRATGEPCMERPEMTMLPMTGSRLSALLLVALLATGLGAGPALAQPAPARDLTEASLQPPLMPGTAVTVTLAPGQSAVFRLPEGAGDLVAETRRLAPGTDTILQLLDAAGRVLEEDDDGGGEALASRIDIEAEQPGPLFLRAGTLGDAGGRFELVILPPRR